MHAPRQNSPNQDCSECQRPEKLFGVIRSLAIEAFPFRLSPSSDTPRLQSMHIVAEPSDSKLLRTTMSDRLSCLVGIHPQECARNGMKES